MAAPDKPEEAPLPPAAASPPPYLAVLDVVLRFLVFASAVVAVVVMVTSKQEEFVSVQIPNVPTPRTVLRPAKFNHSPAFIYFVAALSTAGLYSIITGLVSLLALAKPGCSTKLFVHIIVLDVLMLGIVAAATASAGAVAYIGLKGNSHVGWSKICNIYDKFCRHIGASVFVALFASVLLAYVVILSAYSLSKRIPK
ncbi:hypothetical protein NMG60_11029804 [Bertholletia excelsa]